MQYAPTPVAPGGRGGGGEGGEHAAQQDGRGEPDATPPRFYQCGQGGYDEEVVRDAHCGHFMTAEEAREYGVVDHVLANDRVPVPLKEQ